MIPISDVATLEAVDDGQDRTVQLVSVIGLGAVALTTVIGGVALAYVDKTLPSEIIAIGSAAAGAVARTPINSRRFPAMGRRREKPRRQRPRPGG